MAISRYMEWRMRAAGNKLNGGGFDPTVSGAGTNYADADSPILNLSDFACASNTTLTSATGGFTSAMIGNTVRIASGTNHLKGYYVITGHTDTNTVTIDRTCATGGNMTAGVGRVGGAAADFSVFASGGSGTQPDSGFTSPLAAGHTLWIRGAGTDDPSISSPDFDFGTAGYWTLPNGDYTTGNIRIVGYNGRPCIKSNGLTIYQAYNCVIENIKWFTTSGSPNYLHLGIVQAETVLNCKFDQNGQEACLVIFSGLARGCEFTNTGGTTSSTQAVVSPNAYGARVIACLFTNLRGPALVPDALSYPLNVDSCIIYNCKATSYAVAFTISNTGIRGVFKNSVIDSCAGDGIKIDSLVSLGMQAIYNNIISNNVGSGKYGINVSVGTAAANELMVRASLMDYNNLYNNGAGGTSHYNGINAGAHDVSLDPQFTNASGGDFSVGTNMKAIGYPALIPPL